MTAPSKQLHASPPEVRRKRFIRQVQDEGVDWIATLQEAGVRFETSEQHLVNAARHEMGELITKSAYLGKWDASMRPDDVDMVQATEDMIAHAPTFFGFLKQVYAHKRSHQDLLRRTQRQGYQLPDRWDALKYVQSIPSPWLKLVAEDNWCTLWQSRPKETGY